jgi:hypothetical protein
MIKFSVVLLVAAAGVIATLAAFAPPAAAIEYPWCAQYNGEDGGGGRNCGFVSLEQCMATVSGIGGGCERNLFYEGRAEPSAKRAHRRKTHDD